MPFNDDDEFEMDNEELSDEERNELSKEFEKERLALENHPLYRQANEVTDTLEILLNSSDSEDTLVETHSLILRDSIVLIKAKLYSSLKSDSYLVCMQNASIIREQAEYMRLSSHTLNSMQSYDKTYVSVFRAEMEKFRELFKLWAQEIQQMDRDGVEDEWGLF